MIKMNDHFDPQLISSSIRVNNNDYPEHCINALTINTFHTINTQEVDSTTSIPDDLNHMRDIFSKSYANLLPSHRKNIDMTIFFPMENFCASSK